MKKTIISLGLALVVLVNVSAASHTSVKQSTQSSTVIMPSASPLCVAISKGDLDTVKKFIEYGADVNEKSKNGMTPLMIAATYNKVAIINFLFEKGADAKMKNDNGYTALKFAEVSNSDEAVAVLSEKR